MARISIVMPVHNGEAYLASAIHSIQHQTETNWELICVNDGSVDGTQSILEGFSEIDPRIQVFSIDQSGIVKALNYGIRQARGDLIARMDADDLAMPERLEVQRKFLQVHPSVSVVGGAFQSIDHDGIVFKQNQPPLSPSQVRSALFKGNCLAHASVLMRRSVLANFPGPYRNLFPLAEDYDLWLRISEAYPIANVPEMVLQYRRVLANLSPEKVIQQTISTAAARYIHFECSSVLDLNGDQVIDEETLLSLGYGRERLNELITRELLSNARVARKRGCHQAAISLRQAAWKYSPSLDFSRDSSSFMWRMLKARCA